MKIKVCGIRTVEQMLQLQQQGVDYAGMIFYEGSKRFIGNLSEREQESFRQLPVEKIGVFVNAAYETITKAIADYGLYAVQVHGDETDEFCLELMDKTTVIKVIRVAGEQDIDSLVAPFQAVCHYFLFDTDTPLYGGSGKKFDWKKIEAARIERPFFLSGGIGPDDVENLRSFSHPFFHAVDVNSRFETAPGLKDLVKTEQFIKAMHHG
jgi:phosphoribosylanthranilate isomerase